MFRSKAFSCNINWTLIETLIKTLIFWNKFSDHRVQFSGKPLHRKVLSFRVHKQIFAKMRVFILILSLFSCKIDNYYGKTEEKC